MKRAILAATLAFAAGSLALTGGLIELIGIEDDVTVTAHRGSSRSAPENTLSAVKAAIRQGADYAEIDVQEIADGQIVVFHDTDLKRIAGLDKKIWEVTYDEIRTLDAGTWFSRDFAGEPIPTLQQVIDLARGRIRLNIEVKFHGRERNLVEEVARIVRANDFYDQCVVTSLDHDGLLKAKALDPRLTVGQIVSVALGNVAALDVDFLSVLHERVTPGFVQTLHGAGKEIHVWTVNDAKRMSTLIDLGVDNIITDDPELARSVLHDRAQMTNAERLLLGVRDWLVR